MVNKVWTDEEIEEARLHWFYESGQSFKKTSEELEIPESTLYMWAKRDNWRENRREELLALSTPAVEEFRAAVKLQLSTALTSLVIRMTNTRNDDWFLRALGFLYQVSSDPDTTSKTFDSKVISLTEARVLSKDEQIPERDRLLALASSSLEENFRGGKVSKGRRKT